MRWIWLVVLCACGDNVVPRLVAKTYQVDDVTYTQLGMFHDTQRDEDCRPVGWSDAAIYCTPKFFDALYTDSACTDAISAQPTGYVATYFTLQGKTSLRRLHPVTPSSRAPAQYWTLAQSGCAGPFPAPSDAHWGDIGDELDESAFVRMLRSAPEGDGRLQTISWHTSDGLHQPMGFHDRDLGADCTVMSDTARDHDEVSCVPPAIIIDYYADAACTQPVVALPNDGPTLDIVRLGCDEFASVGDEIATPIYESIAGGCVQSTLPAGWHELAIGGPVDIPKLSRVRQGDGRIQTITLVAGDVHVPDQYLHDTQLGVDCTPAPAPDVTRCMPSYGNIDTYYRDDQCAQPVSILSENVGTCAAPVHYGHDADGFHEVGPVASGPFYVPSTGDICMPQPPPGEPHEVGPLLPIDTFVPAL